MSTSEIETLPEFAPELLKGLSLSGFEDDTTRRLLQAQHILKKGGLQTLVPLLPLLLTLKGKPFTLERHAPFEPFYRTRMPQQNVFKTARQVSKTLQVSGKQKLLLANGRRVSGQEICSGDHVLAVDDHRRVVPALVVDVIAAPAKPGYAIRTRMGVELTIADTHPLLRLDGWIRGSQLKLGDRIASARRGGLFKRRYIDRDRIILTAYILGDGDCVKAINVTTANRAARCEIKEIALRLQGKSTTVRKKGTKAVRLDFSRSKYGMVHKWLTADGIRGKYAWEKRIPSWVFDLSRRDAALFVSRLWATDGMIRTGKSRPSISYCSTSRELAFDLKSLLLKFGIPCTIKRRKAGYRHHVTCRYVRCRDAYIVRVETYVGWRTFLKTFKVPGKPTIALRHGCRRNNNRDTIPIAVGKIIADIASATQWKHTDSLLASGLRYTLQCPLTYEKLRRYIAYFRRRCPAHPRLHELEDLLTGDLFWDQIVAISPLPPERCWDIEVVPYHNYLLDGVASHNSTSLAARGIIHSNCVPFFSTLYIAPLFETIRRFSQNYIRPFIETSPVKALFVGQDTVNSVLQRTFLNRSQMLFSFAFLDAERTRGISCDKISIDEAQNIDKTLLPIIRETMSASVYGGIEEFAGTPKSLANTLEGLWRDSAQSEWGIKCTHCGHWNIPSLAYDLEAMTGPYREDISYAKPATICAKCQKIIYPQLGRWLHAKPNRRWTFAGWHIPQHIMPMHFGKPEMWAKLLGKRSGRGNTTRYMYDNEVCGESSDSGSRLITLSEVRAAAVLPWNCNLEEAVAHIHEYTTRVLAVDWGGGGEEELSFTALAVLGILPDGRIDCLWGHRSLTPHEHLREATLCLRAAEMFQCHAVAHDYTGAGSLRETLMVGAGYPLDRMVPIAYVRATATARPLAFKLATKASPRSHYQADKARSLVLMCHQIKTGQLRFFRDDYVDADSPGLLYDLIALIEEKTESRLGKDIYTILRDPELTDDFAQAVNIGCLTLWNMTDRWPNLAVISHLTVSEELLYQIQPPNKEAITDLL